MSEPVAKRDGMPKWWWALQAFGVIAIAAWAYSVIHPHEMMRAGLYTPVFVAYMAYSVANTVAALSRVGRYDDERADSEARQAAR